MNNIYICMTLFHICNYFNFPIRVKKLQCYVFKILIVIIFLKSTDLLVRTDYFGTIFNLNPQRDDPSKTYQAHKLSKGTPTIVLWIICILIVKFIVIINDKNNLYFIHDNIMVAQYHCYKNPRKSCICYLSTPISYNINRTGYVCYDVENLCVPSVGEVNHLIAL